VICSAPIGSELVVKVAEPDATDEAPRVVAPVEKVTEPVGEPVPELGETLAVKTAGLPDAGAVGETDRVVVVGMSAAFPPPQPKAKNRESEPTIVRARRER
jgi:hypothetical protein